MQILFLHHFNLCAGSVMGISENEISKLGSNSSRVGCIHFRTGALVKGTNPFLLPTVMTR